MGIWDTGGFEWSGELMLLDFILGYHLQDWAQKAENRRTFSKQWKFGLSCVRLGLCTKCLCLEGRAHAVRLQGDRDGTVLGCSLFSGFWKSLGWGQQVLKNQLYPGSEGGKLPWGSGLGSCVWKCFMRSTVYATDSDNIYKLLIKFCIFLKYCVELPKR